MTPTEGPSSAADRTTAERRRLTRTPPLGWNSFDCFGGRATEKILRANLEAMDARLKPHGYRYFVVDIGWYAEHSPEVDRDRRHATTIRIDDYGRPVPAPQSFPHGLEPIIDEAHARGLRFGVHIMRGIPRQAVEENLPVLGTAYRAHDIADVTSTCDWCPYNYGIDMGKPGAQEYYDSYVSMLAGWGVDFIKADDITGFPAEIDGVATAIERSGRPIVLSLSPGGQADPTCADAYRVADMVRTTRDIWDNRAGLERAFDAWRAWAGLGGEGFWPDLDMIPFGRLTVWNPWPESGPESGSDLTHEQNAELGGRGYTRMSALTTDQKQTFITMRALASSPLFMGGDLPTSDDLSFDLITDPDVLGCNQHGDPGVLIHDGDDIEVWRSQHLSNSAAGWVGVFNRRPTGRSVRVSAAHLGFTNPPQALYDTWKQEDLTESALREGRLDLDLGPDGVAFLRFGGPLAGPETRVQTRP